MNKKQYVIAIPSYNRPETIKIATIKLLQEYNIDPKIVYIFVASSEERDKYIKSLENKSYNIIVGELGVKNIRNYMANYFDQGQYIFYLDDDVYKLYECIFDDESIKKVTRKLKNKSLELTEENFNRHTKDGYRLIKLPSLDIFIRKGLALCEKLNYNLFGINPVDNPYFLKVPPNNISTNLKYIIGYCCGVINNRKAELRTVNDKEDYERTIKYYLLDGGVIRYNNICAKTKCYKEPGGLQSTGHRTWEKVDKSAKFLVETYPDLTRLNTRKKNADSKTGQPWTEIRLHDYRKGNRKIFGILPSSRDLDINYT